MKPRSFTPRMFIGLTLAVYLAAGVAVSILRPLGEAPDEPAHFAFARTLALGRGLPVLDRRLEANETVEAFQPPGYYAFGALVAAPWMGGRPIKLYNNPYFEWATPLPAYEPAAEHRWPWRGEVFAYRLLRFYSLALGLLSLWVVWRAAQLVLGRDSWSAAAAVAYVALNPQFIDRHSAVANDPMATLAGCLMVWAMLALIERPGAALMAAAGGALALALLSKLNAPLLAPGLALAVAIAWRRIPSASERWKGLAAFLAIPLAFAGWWFVRNWRLYGDATAMNVLGEAFHYASDRTSSLGKRPAMQMAWLAFCSAWGRFGWGTLAMPGVYFAAIAALHLGALAGLVRLAVRRESQTGAAVIGIALKSKSMALALSCLGLLAGFAHFIAISSLADHSGRWLFPGIAIFAIGGVAGWRAWIGAERIRSLAVAMLVGGAGAILFMLLGVLWPAYSPPQTMPPGFKPSHALSAHYDGSLELIGYDSGADRAEELYIYTLYWRLAAPPPDHLHARLHLTVDGESLHLTSQLEQLRPIYFWPVGEIVAEPYRFSGIPERGVRRATVSVERGYSKRIPVAPLDAHGASLASTPTLVIDFPKK